LTKNSTHYKSKVIAIGMCARVCVRRCLCVCKHTHEHIQVFQSLS